MTSTSRQFPRVHRLAPVLGMLFVGLAIIAVEAGDPAKPLRIGMAKSFFTDRGAGIVDIASGDFKDVMKKTTGLNGELFSKFSVAEVAQKLDAKQLDFGIFHGHEFAWVQQKYPELKPLLIAADKGGGQRAFIIVRKDNPAKSIADLRGKKLDKPIGTKEPCRIFLEKLCADIDAKGSASLFGAITKASGPAAALEDVARDKAQATVIDATALEFFKEIKGPFFNQHLRVLQQSEVFPPAVLVYKPGAVAEATLNQFRAGLVKAHTTDLGRDMMKDWKIAAFRAPPKDYAERLAAALKAYPPPEK